MSTHPLFVVCALTSITGLTAMVGAQVVPCASDGTLQTENLDPDTILSGGSTACSGSGTSPHAYGRSHDLAASGLSGDVEITCVHWGVEFSDEALAATVNIYRDIDSDRAPGSSTGDLVFLGSAPLIVPATETSVFLTATFASPVAVMATDLIFVELDMPETSGQTHVGGNAAGETSPSYLRTTNGDCGIATWTTTGGIGFPSIAWVETVEMQSGAPADPCDDVLPLCPADVGGSKNEPDGTIDVNDVLAVIGNFGITGDGTFRPTGDCSPAPNGNCLCDVDDLLFVIANFGQDCAPDPTGACCDASECDVTTASECASQGGTYLGDDSDCAACTMGSDILLNEARLNQPGDDDDEYLELIGTAGDSLDGLAFIVIGDGNAGAGVIEEAIALDGFSINAAGFFLIGEPTLTIGVPDYAYELNFESSDQTTHMLVSGFTGLLNDDLDTDDDGVLDIEPWTNILDCAAFVGPDPTVGDPVYCDTHVGPDGDYPPAHAYRCDATWYVGTFELSALDTPGTDNQCDTTDSDGDGVFDLVDNCPNLANADQADCDGDGIGDACAIADGLSEDCNTNGVPDECEADCNGNGSPDDCDVADGSSNDCDGNGTPDECDPDCNTNGIPDTCDIADGTSQDSNGNGVPDECEGSVFVINEINADPDSTLGDANGDGVAHYADDEFVEIVNMSGADIDMSGWTLADSTAVRHTFPLGTILSNSCAVVVFGDGEPMGDFGGAIVMASTSGYLGLNNGGDTVTIADADGTAQLVVEYGNASNNQSITRHPDVFGDSWVDHSTVASDGALFSPGTDVNGVGFGGDCGTDPLPDSDDDGVPDDYDNCYLPNPDQNDCNGNDIGDVCDIADGTSLDEDGNGIPDECEETVSGAWVNEFHYDNSGSDLNEFVEIVLLDGTDLANVTLSLYNGSNGTVYASYTGAELTAGETGAGYAIYFIAHAGIQNGSPDGLCLDISGSVSDFVSYEGSLTATEGPASGLTSTDVGVSEDSGTNDASSLGLIGTGSAPGDFMWTALLDVASSGASNDGQIIAP